MGHFKKIGANVVFQGLGRVITSASTFIITVLVAQKFGPASLGDLTKTLSFVALFYLVADFGFNAIVVKDICQNRSKTADLLSNLFSLRIFISLLLILVVFLIAAILPFDQIDNTGFSLPVKIGILVASWTILAQAILSCGNALFQAKLQYNKSTIALFFGSLTTVIIVFVLLNYFFFSWPNSLLPIIVAYVLGGLVSSLLIFVFVKKDFYDFKIKINFTFWLELLKRTWPIGLTLIFNLVYFRIDMFILALVKSSTEVGLYSLSYKVFDLALVFPIFLINASYPTMIETSALGKGELLNFSKKIFGLLFAVSIVFLATIFILSPQIVGLIGGRGFSGSIVSLRILILSLPIFYLTAPLMWILIIFESQKTLILIYALGAILNIVLNLIFIPQFGYLAAAATTGVSELLILLFSSYFVFWKFRKR